MSRADRIFIDNMKDILENNMMKIYPQQIITLYKICGTYTGIESIFGIPATEAKKLLAENGITERLKKSNLFLTYHGLIPREQEYNVPIDDDDLKNLFLRMLETNGEL